MQLPRPGKYVIHNPDDDKRFNFKKFMRHHKPGRPMWRLLLMLFVLIVVYLFLQGILR